MAFVPSTQLKLHSPAICYCPPDILPGGACVLTMQRLQAKLSLVPYIMSCCVHNLARPLMISTHFQLSCMGPLP